MSVTVNGFPLLPVNDPAVEVRESLINVYFRQDGVGARSGNLENLNTFSIFLHALRLSLTKALTKISN
jgi:hypothetical protein